MMQAKVWLPALFAALGCFASSARSECLACKYEGDVPNRLVKLHAAALDALDRFESADAELTQQLNRLTLNPIALRNSLLVDRDSRRWLYPWLLDDRKQVVDSRSSAETSVIDESEETDSRDEQEERDRDSEKFIRFGTGERDENGDETWTLTLRGGEVVWHTPALVNQGRRSGKWYWEVRYDAGSLNFPHRGDVGVGGDFIDISDDQKLLGLPPSLFASLTGGETLQFALDLKKHRLHIGIDNVWLVGNPRHAKSGLIVPKNAMVNPGAIPADPEDDIYPIDIGSPDTMTFNFGRTQFKYRPPFGFSAYDADRHRTMPRQESLMNQRNKRSPEDFFLDRVDATDKFDTETKTLFRKAVSAWASFRDSVCPLSARYEEDSRSAYEYCIRDLNGALYSKLPILSSLANGFSAGLDYEFPVIDLAENPKLHCIFVEPEEGPEAWPPTPFTVSVSDNTSPLVLFLRSDANIAWHLEVAPDVRVRQVIVFGGRRQSIRVSGTVGGVRVYSSDRDNLQPLWKKFRTIERDSGDVQSLLDDAFDNLIGLKTSSVQLECPDHRCNIGAMQQ